MTPVSSFNRKTLFALAVSCFGAATSPVAYAQVVQPTEPPPVVEPIVFNQCTNTYTATPTESCTTCDGKAGKKTATGTGKTAAAAMADAKSKLEKAECVPSTVPNNSLIDAYTFNHVHQAVDYAGPVIGDAGCSSCSASGAIGLDDAEARAGIVRIHSSRETFRPSSFGPGVFQLYDSQLTLFEVNGITYVDHFDPTELSSRRYSPSGSEFRDTIYASFKGFWLFDANGNKTVSRANAVKAKLVEKSGKTWEFDLFDDGVTKSGRVTAIRGLDGLAYLTLNYVNTPGDSVATPDEKRRLSTVSDAHGNTLTYAYGVVGSGRLAVTSVVVPGGRTVTYGYDSQGCLASVDLPNGDSATFSREPLRNNFFRINFADASEKGTHRNKSAYYTNNIAASLLNLTDRPAVYNQSSNLVYMTKNGIGEMKYLGVTGGNGTGASMARIVYEGGGRLRHFDVAKDLRFKGWAATSTLNTTNAYASFVNTAYAGAGNIAPYGNYAQNRSGTPPTISTEDGVAHSYTYDANGNPRTETIGTKTRMSKWDSRFNAPILTTDFTGKTTLCAYDTTGRMISRKTGWRYDTAIEVGTPLAGLKCSYYQNPASLDAFDAATPVSVQQADSVALGQRETSGFWGMRFEGKLNLATAGVRTFKLSADDRARLYIDGVLIRDVAWNQGNPATAVNLTAGAHDIRVDFIEQGGPQRLDLTWSGPETTDAAGNVATTFIGSNFLSHATVAGELTLRATPAAAEETWEYYPAGHAAAGMEKAYVDGSGKRTERIYDAQRRLVEVRETGDAGSLVTVLTLTYDSAGRLATRVDALGRTITYAYDARDRLVKTTYGDATTETVTYGTGIDANLVITQKDRAGSVTKFEYDVAGRRVKTLTGYAFADNDGAITSVLPNPSVETVVYLRGTDDPASVTRDGKITEYDYDYRGRVIATRSFPASAKTLESKSYNGITEQRFCEQDAHGCRTFYAYRDSDKTLVREIREIVPGALTSVTSVFGNVATLSASTMANATVLAVARAAGPNPGYAITDYDRDNDGRVTATIDPLGVRTESTYDAAGRVIATTRAAGTASAATSTTTYDAAGRIVAQADPLGRTTTRTYTPAGRIASVLYPDAKTEEFTYYGDGKLATRKDPDGFTAKQKWSVCCGRDFASANPKGEGQLKFYDGPGRVTYAVSVKDVETAAAFVSFGSGITIPSDAVTGAQTMKYDARGRLVASTQWLVAPAGVDPKNPPIATDPAQGLTTTYAYFDDLSDARFAEPLAALAAQGVTLTAGSATVVTNPAGESSFSIQDAAGRTVFNGTFNK